MWKSNVKNIFISHVGLPELKKSSFLIAQSLSITISAHTRVTLYTAGHLHTAVPHCWHSGAPIVHTAVPRENNEHGCVYLRCTAVCKLPGCVEGHPWHSLQSERQNFIDRTHTWLVLSWIIIGRSPCGAKRRWVGLQHTKGGSRAPLNVGLLAVLLAKFAPGRRFQWGMELMIVDFWRGVLLALGRSSL